MEKINPDYQRRTRKIEAKLFKMHNPFVGTDEMREINDRVRKQSRTRQIGKSYGSINVNQLFQLLNLSSV